MYRKILVALDGSGSSQRALAEAIRMAALMRAQVCAVYVLDHAPAYPYTCHYDLATMTQNLRLEGRAALDDAKRAFAAAGIAAQTELIETLRMTEDVPACLLRRAQLYGADLVVMGTHGRRGVHRAMLGSVAEHFLRVAACPVLLVRGDDEVR